MRGHAAAMDVSTLYGASPPTYQSILGALLVEMWHSQVGVALSGGNVVSWAGQIANVVLSAPSVPRRPTYVADGSNFGGKSVVGCAVSGNKNLRTNAAAILLPTGTKPYLFSVGRIKAVPATQGDFACFVDAYPSATSDVDINVSSGGLVQSIWFPNPAGSLFGVTAAPLTVSRFEWYVRASDSKPVVTVNGTATAAATSGSITVTCNVFQIGGDRDTRALDSSHWVHLLCSGEPSAAQKTAICALAASEAGSPP